MCLFKQCLNREIKLREPITIKVKNLRWGNSTFSVGSCSHEGSTHYMLMRLNIRRNIFAFLFLNLYLCNKQVSSIILHRCCHLVAHNRCCSVPPTVPVHLKNFEVQERYLLISTLLKSEAQERRSLASRVTMTTGGNVPSFYSPLFPFHPSTFLPFALFYESPLFFRLSLPSFSLSLPSFCFPFLPSLLLPFLHKSSWMIRGALYEAQAFFCCS